MMIASSSRSSGRGLGPDDSDEVSDVLTQWGFEDLIPVFANNEIDILTFQTLTQKDLSNFLPYKKVLDFYPVFEEKVTSLKRKRVDSDASTHLTSKDAPTLRISDVPPGTSSVSKDDNVFLDDDEDGEPVDEELVSDLKNLLESLFAGQILLRTTYEDTSDADRNHLASIITCDELRKTPSKSISSTRLRELAKAIARIFRGENSTTFYTPYRKIKNKVFQANGKLLTQMYAWRQRAIAVGLIDPVRPLKKSKPNEAESDVPDDVGKAIDWLRVNLGPFSTATIHWQTSFNYRDRFLVATPDLCAIDVYYNTFPILRQPKLGLELLLQDYNQSPKLHATSDNFLKYWPDFSARFMKKLTSKIIPLEELAELKLLVEKEKGVNVCHHFLLQFSRIFPTPVTVKGKKPYHWTATKAEIQLGFLGHYHSEEEFRTSILNKVTKYKSFKKPLGFQPFAAIVGPSIRRVQKCYVVIQPNDIYEVDTPYEAIDSAFKAIQVLDAHYPPESKFVWLTLQQGLYKLFTPSDAEITCSGLAPILKYFNKA